MKYLLHLLKMTLPGPSPAFTSTHTAEVALPPPVYCHAFAFSVTINNPEALSSE
jgi:hypothetical protein